VSFVALALDLDLVLPWWLVDGDGEDDDDFVMIVENVFF